MESPQASHMRSATSMVTFKNPINIVAALGLALGAVFGMAGAFVAQPNIQALPWAIDGAGLVTADRVPHPQGFQGGT